LLDAEALGRKSTISNGNKPKVAKRKAPIEEEIMNDAVVNQAISVKAKRSSKKAKAETKTGSISHSNAKENSANNTPDDPVDPSLRRSPRVLRN